MKIFNIKNNCWIECSDTNICLDDYNTCILYHTIDKKVIPYGIGIVGPKYEGNLHNIKEGDVIDVNHRGNNNQIKTVYVTHVDEVGIAYSFVKNGKPMMFQVWNCFNNNFISFSKVLNFE